jgi:N-acetylmuramoyl-L-alanine amidase
MSVKEIEQSLELWTRRLRKRKELLGAAEKELAQARAQNIHPRRQFVEKVATRRAQVEEAQRMVDRRQDQLADREPDADGFMDGVERVVLEDAGEHVAGRPKLCWHSTEGSTIDGAIAAFKANRSAPHFTIDPGIDRIVQHISVHKAARALEHPSGTVETNRARTVQVEIVGRAAEMGGLSRAELDSLARLARWIERNADVPSKCSVEFVPFPSGVPKKLQGQAWLDYSGHCGHMHVPFNDHEDPGALAIKKILNGNGNGKVG